MKNDTLFYRFLWLILAIVIISLSLLMASGCQVLKGKRSVTSDSTKVVRVDSGSVKVNTNDKKDSLAWWREIINLSRDTTILTPGVTNVYPTSYIREGGTRTIVEKSVNYDSLWNNRLDSLSRVLVDVSKSKETKVMGFWQIVGVALGCGIVLLVISKLKIGIK